MTARRVKVGDKVKVTIEGKVEKLGDHAGCVHIVAGPSEYNHWVYLPQAGVTPGVQTNGGVTVEWVEPEYVIGKAYQDNDGDVFIRTHDNRWVGRYGDTYNDDYATRPLRLLVPEGS